MKLKDLMEKYGEYEIDSTGVIGKNGEVESITIDLTKPKTKTVWELEEGDEYYYINADGYINLSTYAEIESEENGVNVGNVFLTYEEAKKDLERRRVEALLLKYGGRRWFKSGRENWFISFDCSLCFFKYTIIDPRQGTIYFDTEEKLKKAVEQIGEDRIIKALFEVR